MREIKFRAWDKELEMMAYSDQHNSKDYDVFYEFNFWRGDTLKCTATESYDDCWGDSQESITDLDNIMQYTGLKDKNGKEIYEGDIIKYDTIDFITYNLVKWGKVEFSFLKKQLDGTIHRTTYQGLSKYGEVIGNIYENPTLWEEVKSMTTF